MERRVFKYKHWTVEVFCKQATDGLVPLKYNIYYGEQKVNSLIGQKHVKAIDEAIHELFTGTLQELH